MQEPLWRRRHHKVRYIIVRAFQDSSPVELNRPKTDAHHTTINDSVKFEVMFLSRALVLRFRADFLQLG